MLAFQGHVAANPSDFSTAVITISACRCSGAPDPFCVPERPANDASRGLIGPWLMSRG